MVCFSDFQKIFNSLSISLIATPGCILCTAKLKRFIPLTCRFFHFCYCYFLRQKSTHVKDYLNLVTSIYHTSFPFHTNTYTHICLRALLLTSNTQNLIDS